MAGHRLVRQQHELLDQPVRHVPLGADDALDEAVGVEHDLGLVQVEVHRAPAPPPAVEHLEELLHQLEHRHEPIVPRHDLRAPVREDGVHRGVRHALVAVDHPVVELVAHHVASAVDLHQARLHQPVHVRVQAAEPGGQLGREHVHRALGEVDRRRAVVGVLVERRAFADVVRHVGDVHAQPVAPVRQPLDRDRVVEVAGMLPVDRHRRPAAEIGASLEVALADRAAETARLGHGGRAVLVHDAVLAQDDLDVHAGRVDRSEHLGHPSHRPPRRGRPAGDLDHHHLARRRAARLALRHLHVHDHPPVERHHEAEAGPVHVVATDGLLRRALEDPHDAALGPVAGLHPLDARDDAIAVHGLVEVRPLDEDVALDVVERPLRDDEPETARVRLDAPHHEVHPIRQAEALPTDLDQVARGDERLELALEARALVPGDLQALQELLDGRRMVDLVADGGEKLIGR